MLTELTAGRFTLRGASLGGMYTSLHVPELDACFDVGVAVRSAAAVERLFLSHAHVDHVGALATLLGMRGLSGVKAPLKIHLPEGVEGTLAESLRVLSGLHRWPLTFEAIPMRPGDEVRLRGKRFVRAFKTYHPVPSLGYAVFERVSKLKPEHADLPGARIGELRRSGADIFDVVERPLLAYATDTLPEVLHHEPWLGDVSTLILECTFLDERKTIHAARAGCHIHLDELLSHHAMLRNDRVVLMHFSQIYKPGEVRAILDQRLPSTLRDRVIPFLPATDDQWWN